MSLLCSSSSRQKHSQTYVDETIIVKMKKFYFSPSIRRFEETRNEKYICRQISMFTRHRRQKKKLHIVCYTTILSSDGGVDRCDFTVLQFLVGKTSKRTDTRRVKYRMTFVNKPFIVVLQRRAQLVKKSTINFLSNSHRELLS